VLENIATVLQFRTNSYLGEAEDIGWKLLTRLERRDCAAKRDPDLDHEERFIAKLLRALVLQPPLILIDRPAQQLPDTDYPPFLSRLLRTLDTEFSRCWILDYEWNRPLYRRRG
jgi:ABC-type molybdenum transport system ATPase subunit/photorepair protein PhrA